MSAAGFTSEAIRPLVTHEQATGRHLIVTFRCPESGQNVQARWSAPQQTQVGAQVASQAKRTAMTEVRRNVNNLLRSVLGTGALANIANNAVNTALSSVEMSASTQGAPTLSTTEKDQGLIEAFRSVQQHFVWKGGRWVHKSVAANALSDFERQLADHAVNNRYDKLLVARMLVETAASHGGISDDERLHLADLLDPDLGSLEALAARPPLTSAELSEASKGPVRVSMVSLVWSLALCDERLDQAEQGLIDRFAKGLALSSADAGRARALATGFLLDQALERVFTYGEHDQAARAELLSLGQRLGMSREEVELAEARFQRRRA